MEHETGLAVMDVRSGGIRQVTKRTNIFPAFSPDGKWIVFGHSTAAHSEGLWIIDSNGQRRRYLAHGDGGINPVLSPDGKRIAMLRKGALFVVNVDGSGRTALVKPSFRATEKLDWSPDGSRILFSQERKVFTIRPDGTGLTRLTSRGKICSESFSPNGLQILALADCDTKANSYLVTM
jgi:Tol biopolymer transport system component